MSKLASEQFPLFELSLLRGEQGDDEAREAEWERVFAHFHPRLSSYFGRRADGIYVLDDLLQEIWLRAFLNVQTLESASALWTWLVTVGNNLLRDELRRKKLENVSIDGRGDGSQDGIDEFLGNLERAPGGGNADLLDELRGKLTEEEWEFLNLLCVDNLTHEEVARRLNLNTAMASRQRLRRIRQRIADVSRSFSTRDQGALS